MSINALIREPKAPHSVVNSEACICGEEYKDFRIDFSFTEARELVKERCLTLEGHDGYKSRRSVLWAMRVVKLEAWYMRHALCNLMDADEIADARRRTIKVREDPRDFFRSCNDCGRFVPRRDWVSKDDPHKHHTLCRACLSGYESPLDY